MAFAIGIRLASYAVAGAALIITHETTKATKEKLRQWVADKFTSRSSDLAFQPPNPCDAAVNEGGDLGNGRTPSDIQEPTLSPVKVTENAVKADPTVWVDNAVNGERPAHLEEPTLTAVNVTENAVTSESSDPAPQPPNPCDAGRKAVNEGGDFVNGGTPADIQEPTLTPVKVTENTVTGDPMAEGDNAVNGERSAHPEEPTLTAVNLTENAVEGDPTVEQSQPNQDKAINVPVSGEFPSHLHAESNAVNGDLTVEPLQLHGVNPTRLPPALVVVEAVSLEATSVQRTVDDVDNAVRVDETRAIDNSHQTDLDELAQYAPDPAPPPGQGIRGSFVAAAVDAVKDCARSLFNWPTAIKGYVSDPNRDKMRRILVKVVFPVMECVILEPLLRRHKVVRKIYDKVKKEFWIAWCW